MLSGGRKAGERTGDAGFDALSLWQRPQTRARTFATREAPRSIGNRRCFVRFGTCLHAYVSVESGSRLELLREIAEKTSFFGLTKIFSTKMFEIPAQWVY